MTKSQLFREMHLIGKEYVSNSPKIILNLEYSFKNSKIISAEERNKCLSILECLKHNWRFMKELLLVLEENKSKEEYEEIIMTLSPLLKNSTEHTNILEEMMVNNKVGEEEITLNLNKCEHEDAPTKPDQQETVICTYTERDYDNYQRRAAHREDRDAQWRDNGTK